MLKLIFIFASCLYASHVLLHIHNHCLFLFNGVVEKTRKKTEVSIAVAADAIGIPRTLIDIRHGEQLLLLTCTFIIGSLIKIFLV